MGEIPDSSTNRLAKFRSLIRAWRAIASIDRGWAMLRRMNSRVRSSVEPCGSGIGVSMYCACPPPRYCGTTNRRAIVLATAAPWSANTT